MMILPAGATAMAVIRTRSPGYAMVRVSPSMQPWQDILGRENACRGLVPMFQCLSLLFSSGTMVLAICTVEAFNTLIKY